MKPLLFVLFANLANFLINLNNSIGNTVINILMNLFNFINACITACASFIMTKIDKERFTHMKSTVEQYQSLVELDLMMAATKIKEDAIKNRVWTPMHTIAINKIGNALNVKCGWEPVKIHGYLRQVIESIPGMTYTTGDE